MIKVIKNIDFLQIIIKIQKELTQQKQIDRNVAKYIRQQVETN